VYRTDGTGYTHWCLNSIVNKFAKMFMGFRRFRGSLVVCAWALPFGKVSKEWSRRTWLDGAVCSVQICMNE
jgi:hypothetical protein